MKTIKVLLAALLMVGLSSCGYKKSVGDEVYIQLVKMGNGGVLRVAHSNPDCPDIDSYFEEPTNGNNAVTVCAKCVKSEDAHKILKE